MSTGAASSETAASGTPPKQTESQEGDDHRTQAQAQAQQPEGQDGTDSAPPSAPKPGVLARLGLDLPTMMMMFK